MLPTHFLWLKIQQFLDFLWRNLFFVASAVLLLVAVKGLGVDIGIDLFMCFLLCAADVIAGSQIVDLLKRPRRPKIAEIYAVPLAICLNAAFLYLDYLFAAGLTGAVSLYLIFVEYLHTKYHPPRV